MLILDDPDGKNPDGKRRCQFNFAGLDIEGFAMQCIFAFKQVAWNTVLFI